MKSRTSEKGSAAHIIIIVVLAIAVLGLLGYVFWQNFMGNNAVTTDTTTPTTSTTESTNKERTITIEEWGIKGTYTYTEDLIYEYKDYGNGESSVQLTTPAIEAGKICTEASTGAIVRYKGDVTTNIGPGSTGNPDITAKDAYDTMEVPNVSYSAKARVGDYYFFMSNPSGVCAEEGSELVDTIADVMDVTQEFILNLEEV